MHRDQHLKRHAQWRADFEKLMAELPESRDLKADRLKQSGENVVAFEDPSKPTKTAGELICDFVAKIHREDEHDTDQSF